MKENVLKGSVTFIYNKPTELITIKKNSSYVSYVTYENEPNWSWSYLKRYIHTHTYMCINSAFSLISIKLRSCYSQLYTTCSQKSNVTEIRIWNATALQWHAIEVHKKGWFLRHDVTGRWDMPFLNLRLTVIYGLIHF